MGYEQTSGIDKDIAHQHQANGIIERHQRNLIDRIRYAIYDQGGCWTEHVEWAVDCIQNMMHKSLE